MSDEYIRKADAIKQCGFGMTSLLIADNLRRMPPVDVAPVVHSRWIKTIDGAECENCGREAVYQIVDDHWEYEPWCPHCGAKMDG